MKAQVGVALLLGGRSGSYHVSCLVKTLATKMGDRFVLLFSRFTLATEMGDRFVPLLSKQTLDVSSSQRTKIPLMVSLVCLPNGGDVELTIVVYLILIPCSNNERVQQWETILDGANCLKFNPRVTREEHEVNGNKIEVTIKMSAKVLSKTQTLSSLTLALEVMLFPIYFCG